MTGDANLELQSVSGRVRVTVQVPNGYSYDLSTFSGALRNCFGYEVHNAEHRGYSTLSGVRGEGKGSLRVKSHSGNVDLCDH